MLGYIRDGHYYKGTRENADNGPTSSLVKAGDHDDQRFMHQADLVQPYKADGSINPEFVDLYYEESKTYGFVSDADSD
jgi:hypothetical protein